MYWNYHPHGNSVKYFELTNSLLASSYSLFFINKLFVSLNKIICSKRNTKRKIHTGSTDIYFVSYMSYRTSLASEKREDRYQVKLENGRILSAEHKNVRPDRAIPIRGAHDRRA